MYLAYYRVAHGPVLVSKSERWVNVVARLLYRGYQNGGLPLVNKPLQRGCEAPCADAELAIDNVEISFLIRWQANPVSLRGNDRHSPGLHHTPGRQIED